MAQKHQPSAASAAKSKSNAPSKASVRKVLLALIETDLKNAQELREILENVKLALSERETKTLQTLIESQQPVLTNMHQTAKQRATILHKMGLQDNAADWQLVLQKFDLEEDWEPLRKTLKRCHDLNEVNQRVVQRSRQTVGRLIDIFRGESGQPALYNADGDTRSRGPRGRTISTA